MRIEDAIAGLKRGETWRRPIRPLDTVTCDGMFFHDSDGDNYIFSLFDLTADDWERVGEPDYFLELAHEPYLATVSMPHGYDKKLAIIGYFRGSNFVVQQWAAIKPVDKPEMVPSPDGGIEVHGG